MHHEYFYDSIVTNIYTGGGYYNLYGNYLTANHFDTIYFAGCDYSGVYLEESDDNIFTHIRVDNHYQHGIYMGGTYGCDLNRFLGIEITNQYQTDPAMLDSDGTFHGIQLTGTASGWSDYNTFIGIYVGPKSASGIYNDYSYGINETTGCNYNLFIGITADRDCDDGAINLTGAQSKAPAGSTIGTIA